jgi:hypothetical protein
MSEERRHCAGNFATFSEERRHCGHCGRNFATMTREERSVMNRPEPSPAANLQVNMDLSPSLVPCFRALAFALAIYILALAYAHVAGPF